MLADALLGLRVDLPGGGGSMTIPLRTTPPPYASGAGGGVGVMGYSGAYPLTRLRVGEFSSPTTSAALPAGFQASLFAYAPFSPSREEDMAHPAVIFTLVVSHTSTTPFNANTSITSTTLTTIITLTSYSFTTTRNHIPKTICWTYICSIRPGTTRTSCI